MPQYLKKTSIGRMVPATGGISDSELVEVRLSAEEYRSLYQRTVEAEKQNEMSKKMINDVYKEANVRLNEYQRMFNDKLRRMKEKLDETEHEIAHLKKMLEQQKKLNYNLKRIAKERANAKRGLIPKKERSGYVVLFSSQFRERYLNKKGEKCVSNTWKTVLQTPYDSTIPLESIKEDMFDELLHKVLHSMGFRQIQPVEMNGEYRCWYAKDDSGNAVEQCGIYRWDYKANYKKGFWEITLYHTLSITVPEEYRLI